MPTTTPLPRASCACLVLLVLAAGTHSLSLAAPSAATPAELGSPEALRALLASGEDADLRWPDFSDYRDQVAGVLRTHRLRPRLVTQR